ncbi:archaetidylserine decarboxylase [Lichenicola sp.]|uniref:archaetidylserine decarboxylase n=1 Tax=Lichenicola sp. TaxID=2804529 RepID=UPI003AFFEDB5
MTIRAVIGRITRQENVNFLLSNAIPRRSMTRLVGWFSRIEQPLVRDASFRVWRLFSSLDLSDAEHSRFRSLHDCFTRRLKPGARPIDPDPSMLVSPCDAIVGASGTIRDGMLLQVKGMPYRLDELLDDEALADEWRDGRYVTLRLTAGMYHRFHAPHDCTVTCVTHIYGDVWNVNPPTLKRVARLFCRNERAVLTTTLPGGHRLLLVPVAAILVAGIRLSFMQLPTGKGRRIRWSQACDATLRKGDEMGWFEHGSTIIVIGPPGLELCAHEGTQISVGQPLMRLP